MQNPSPSLAVRMTRVVITVDSWYTALLFLALLPFFGLLVVLVLLVPLLPLVLLAKYCVRALRVD